MDSASGFLRAAVQSLSMSPKVVTINSATANYQLMHLSAMELISTSGSGQTRTIADFGQSGVLLHSGLVSATGGSPSTNEQRHYFTM